jgi:Na+/proline symporter
MISYLGWVAAQITALGLVFNLLSNEAISLTVGMVIGTIVVLTYTVFGGMWSVAMTDFLQMVIIVIGLTLIAIFAGQLAGGADKVFSYAASKDMFRFLPESTPSAWMFWISSAITIMIGSIPQQDVFQRVTSAKDEKTAVRGCLIGGSVYFAFAFVPIFIAYAALVIDPGYAKLFANEDAREIQRILPNLILERTPMWAQILFFGALLSAILSTASGALMAPTALFTENVVRPFSGQMSDRTFMLLLRTVLVTFTLAALLFALNSRSTMYEMVQNAYKVTLVSCIVPLAAGIFWPRATAQGALLSIALGLSSWIGMELYAPDGLWPPQLVGLAFSIAGMIGGSYASRAPHHAAAHTGGMP